MKRLPLLCLALLLALAGCGESATQPIPPNLQELRAKEAFSESFAITYTYNDSARLKARLKAPHDIERFDPETPSNEIARTFHLFDRGFELVFYDRLGNEESRITANQGRYYPAKGLAHASGKVIVINVKGEKLETEQLTWEQQTDQIRTNAPVRITTAQELLFGDGLVSNTAFTNYRITKFKGTVALEK